MTQALRLAAEEPADEPDNTAHTLFDLAQLARLEQDLDQADEHLVRAEAIYRQLGEDNTGRYRSQVAFERGRVANDRGERPGAVRLFRQALAAIPDPDADPSAAALVHYHLAWCLIQDDVVSEALHQAVASYRLYESDDRRLAGPDDRRRIYETHRDSYGLALHCAARAEDGRQALAIMTSARSEALSAFVRAGTRLSRDLRALGQRDRPDHPRHRSGRADHALRGAGA